MDQHQIDALVDALNVMWTHMPPGTIQVAAPPGGTSKSLIAEPQAYDGGPNYRDFRRECLLYIQANSTRFQDGRSKILFILSYLKTGTAATWASNYVNGRTNDQGEINVPNDFQVFLTSLDLSFDDPNKKSKALTEWRKLYQGRWTADEFFTHLDIVRTEAGLTSAEHDAILIDRLKVALNEEVVMAIMRSSPIPTTYAEWKKKAIECDNVERQIREARQLRREVPRINIPTRRPPQIPIRMPQGQPQASRQQPFRPPVGPPPQMQRPQQQPNRQHWDTQNPAPGIHPGQGVPMDVQIAQARRNNLCFICGKPGHFARQCKEQGNVIRGMFQEMHPDVRLAFAEELNAMPESAFLGEEDTTVDEGERDGDEVGFMERQA